VERFLCFDRAFLRDQCGGMAVSERGQRPQHFGIREPLSPIGAPLLGELEGFTVSPEADSRARLVKKQTLSSNNGSRP
jgi:hypothetical protein